MQVLLDKFEHGSARGAEGKVPPPWSSKMLAYLALLSLRPPTSSEQVSERDYEVSQKEWQKGTVST